MNLYVLVMREIVHRRLNFMLGLLSVACAVACLMTAVMLLNLFDRRTEELVSAKQAELEKQTLAMEDEFRKITKRMGFNILILPQDQNLGDFYAENYADKTMPQAYAHQLADEPNIVTIRHLLPMLQAKLTWPEQRRKILLIGVQGEMPWAHRDNKQPILRPVPPGTVAVGYELHQSLGLKTGDAITLMGMSFQVGDLHPERGSIDDVTLWIDLAQAQQLLDKPGRISLMMALECGCAWANLPVVREEIQRFLPDTQVVELAGKALARAEARREATRNAELLLVREQETRQALRREREELFAILVPLVLIACVLLVGILATLNVRERRVEMGVLRALGLHTGEILKVFLGKAVVLGLVGALLGTLGVFLLATSLVGRGAEGHVVSEVLTLALVAVSVLVTPVVTVIASWLPALMAAQQDPALVLGEE
jgi:ABC-type lipoprotein release transport system permease subunit